MAHLNYSVICDESWYSGGDGSEAAEQVRALRMRIYSRFMLIHMWASPEGDFSLPSATCLHLHSWFVWAELIWLEIRLLSKMRNFSWIRTLMCLDPTMQLCCCWQKGGGRAGRYSCHKSWSVHFLAGTEQFMPILKPNPKKKLCICSLSEVVFLAKIIWVLSVSRWLCDAICFPAQKYESTFY